MNRNQLQRGLAISNEIDQNKFNLEKLNDVLEFAKSKETTVIDIPLTFSDNGTAKSVSVIKDDYIKFLNTQVNKLNYTINSLYEEFKSL